MISTKNPFPGMDPYLEREWPDVHTRLIGYFADALGTVLPPGLVARSEESIAVDEIGGEGHHHHQGDQPEGPGRTRFRSLQEEATGLPLEQHQPRGD